MSTKHFILIIILVFSFVIRVWHLDSNPIGFFADEASVGYDAKLIGETGKDRHGVLLPLFFQGFNYDNVSPYQVYLTVPFVKAFGLSEMAVRLTPVCWSIFELFVFYLVLSMLISSRMALLGTLLLSISPWHYHISRINMGDFYSWTLLTLIAYFFLVKYCKLQIPKYAILSGIFLALATYSYTPARLISPLLFIILVSLFILKKQFKIAVLMGITFLFFLIPFLYFQLTNPHSFQRIKDTMGIDLQQKGTVDKIDNQYALRVINKYLSHYSTTFLFTKGDASFPGQLIQRHSISGMGLLYPYQSIFIIIGLLWVIRKIWQQKRIDLIFLLALFFIFPVADSLTNDNTPFATRSYLGILPFHILMTYGIFALYKILHKFLSARIRKVVWIYGGILIVYIAQSLTALYLGVTNNPEATSSYWGWQFGPRDIIRYFKSVEDNYDELYMSRFLNSPEIFYAFYTNNECKKCKIGGLENENPEKKQLFALGPEEININQKNIRMYKSIHYPNGQTAFIIFEVKNTKN